MKKVIITMGVVALMASVSFGADGEPKKANKYIATLVNAWQECTSPSEATGAPLSLDACPAVDPSGASCNFLADKGKGLVKAKAKDDISVQVTLTKLENCEGAVLCGFATARATTNDCTVSSRCTAEDQIDFPATATACCTVEKGKCKIKTTVNTLLSGAIPTGENTSVALQEVRVAYDGGGLGTVAGTAVATAGLLVP